MTPLINADTILKQPTTPPSEFHANYQVAIVGAGLVGLLLAIVVRQAGYSVIVCDKDSELKEIGAGIILPANACRALEQAGVLNKVHSCAVAPKEWISHSYHNGAALGRMNLDPYIREHYDMPFLVIHRPDLRRILFEEAEARGACIRFGTAVDMQRTDFENGFLYTITTNTITTTTGSDGKGKNEEVFATDLAVAADGQQSEARAYLMGQANRPIPTSKMVNRILISIERMRELGLEDLITPPCIHVWLGPGSLAVGYLLKNVFNFVLTCSSEKEQSVFVGPKPVEKEELLAVFQDWDPRIRSLVENGHGFLKWLLLDNSDNELRSWVRAGDNDKLTLALTGDAAHAIGPYIGSGAALGFESAIVLGNLLAQAARKSDIPRVLEVYESLRRPRTDLVGRITQKMAGNWMLPDGPLQAERDRVFLEEDPPLLGYPNALQDPFFQSWLYSFDGRHEAEEAWRIYRQNRSSQATD